MKTNQKNELLSIWSALDKQLKMLNYLAPEIKAAKEAAKVDEAVSALTKAVSNLSDILPNR